MAVAGYIKDHPRVCGESFFSLFFLFFVLGSPPRVRGKSFFYIAIISTVRITPACAGKVISRDLCKCLE